MHNPLSHKTNGNYLIYRAVPVFVILLSLESFSLSHGNNYFSDSTYKVFPDVEVNADRYKGASSTYVSPGTFLTKSEFEKISITQISDVLNFIPGIFIKDYGGLSSMKTISMRGTSSNQTIITLNGARINSNQNGIAELSTIPLTMLDNIEVIRTGLSGYYGSGAIGGVVNLSLDNNSKDRVSLMGAYGSFNENLFSIFASNNLGKINISAALEYKHTDGTFPITTEQFGESKEVVRQNNKFSSISAVLNATQTVFGSQYIGTMIFTHSGRGVPGALLQGFIETADANLEENNFLFSLQGKDINFKDFIVNNGVNFRINNFRYTDQQSLGLDGKTLDNFFTSFDFSIFIDAKRQLGDFILGIKAEQNMSSIKGDFLQKVSDDKIERNNFALSLSAEYRYYFDNSSDLLILTNVRGDMFNDNESAVSPFLGIVLGLTKWSMLIKTNVSYNFRVPSFNELYYLNYGTADLRPEKALNYTSSIEYNNNLFTVELCGFITSTRDLILAVPKSPAIWSAQNIGFTKNIGFELSSRISLIKDEMTMMINYTYQEAKDVSENSLNSGNYLVYVPQELINIGLNATIFDFDLSGFLSYASFRYSLQSNELNSVLPEYYTLNIRISKDINIQNFSSRVFLSCDNITDESYSIVLNYPMPGRIIRAGVKFNIE